MSELTFISKSILILLILVIGGIGVQTCSNDHPAIDFDKPWLDVSAESSSSAEEPSSSSAEVVLSSSSEQSRLLKEKVTGFLQKGPFLRSATVTLSEL
ncbi:MAG: hypothetical protein LBC85_07415, partial [Fibromonadaceae bacterium]|nr:hypothetical protein [Fibromonadaceae bacterium]